MQVCPLTTTSWAIPDDEDTPEENYYSQTKKRIIRNKYFNIQYLVPADINTERDFEEFGNLALTTNIALVDFDIMETIYSLNAQKDIHAAIKYLYDYVDNEFIKSNFYKINNFLALLNLQKTRPEFWIAILTITLPARSKLAQREVLFQNISRMLKEEGYDSAKILKGL